MHGTKHRIAQSSAALKLKPRGVLFVANLSNRANLVRAMAVAQLRERFLGTWAGIIWAFINPLILIAIFWVVFAQGFKMPTGGDHPFLLILICGMVPWMAFSDAVLGGAGSVVARAYIVRKIAFPLELLPITSVASSMIVHLPMLLFAFVIVLWYGRWPGLNLIFLPLYSVGLVLLSTGLGLLTSALCVAFRDLQQAIGVVMNIVFWATPIVWSRDILPPNYQWMLKVNPVTYLVEGYRYALIGSGVPAPSVTNGTIFWLITFALLGSGYWLFERFKASFADML